MNSELKANVLLVDDKPENLLALETVLADLGQNLVRASSAREALRFLLLEDVALILLDVQMPGLSGFELAELIRERERTQNTPLIFISATSINEQFIFKGYSLGAVDYLTKPVQPEILKSKVRFFTTMYLQKQQILRQSSELEDKNNQLDILNADLEERVKQRTAELLKANSELEAEVADRRMSEARLATEHAVTRALASADSVGSAVSGVLRAFIENMKAEIATQWELTPEGDELRVTHIELPAERSQAVAEFAERTRSSVFSYDVGLPGQVWKENKPVLIASTLRGEKYPRAVYAAAAGLVSAVGFPVTVGPTFHGVIEFFTKRPLSGDKRLMEMLESIGVEVGQFIQKKRIEEERESLLIREKMLREEAENANRLKDEFLATISHELRTPLNSILGWSQIVLNETVAPQRIKPALETIHRNATSQAKLIEDLLEASRLITGKILLNLGPTEVVPMIEAAIDVVRPKAVGKNIEIRTTYSCDVPVITCDASRLQQMVLNLLSNAVKFTRSRGTIDVLYERNEDEVRIVVADTGIGISPDFLPYVFDRFRQQDSSSTRNHDGLGLGLAIVGHLAELHGGRVSAESEGVGKGARFSISFPLTESARTSKISQPIAEVPAETEPAGNLSGITIHVVDDDVDACNMLKFAFEMRGATVQTSHSASDALDAISKQPPDVVLADISMPGEDGYTLLKKLRDLPNAGLHNFPVIALTALAREEDTERTLAAGFALHIPKPVEIDELTETIAGIVSRDPRSNGAATV